MMDMFLATESTQSRNGWQTSSCWTTGNCKPRCTVVAVDAMRELPLVALKFALENYVGPGEKLYLLGILHQLLNPAGYKEKVQPFRWDNKLVIQGEVLEKKAEFEREINNDAGIQKLVELKQVTPVVHIAAGPIRKVVMARQAMELQATCIILDKHLKNDKHYLIQELNCNLILMKPKNQAIVIKLARPEQENENPNSPGRCVISCEFCSIPGRCSMSTSPVATFCRPAHSDRAFEVPMNVVNPTPSTPLAAGTSTSERSVQRSPREDDLNLLTTPDPIDSGPTKTPPFIGSGFRKSTGHKILISEREPSTQTSSGSRTSTGHENRRSEWEPSPQTSSGSGTSTDHENRSEWEPSTQTSSGSRTSTDPENRSEWEPTTGQENPSTSLLSSEEIPYEVALAMAIEASIVSATEEGVPVSPSAMDSFLLNKGLAYMGSSDRSNADNGEFRADWIEREQSRYDDWGRDWGTGTSRLGPSIADMPSTSGSSKSGTPKPSTPHVTAGLARSSSQSSSVVALSTPLGRSSSQPRILDGTMQYPSVDTSPISLNNAEGSTDNFPAGKKKNQERSGGNCVVCWDAPAEAVCIPCGHIAGCKECLTKIKSKKWGCPVCRTAIKQVVKVYAV